MKSHKGLSYIELILVLTISIIVVGLASLGVGLVSRNNVTKAGDKLNSAVAESRSVSITKGTENGKIVLSKVGSKYYYTLDGTTKQFASDPVSVVYNNGGTSETVSTSHSVEIKFNRMGGLVGASTDPSVNYDLKLSNGSKEVVYRFKKVTGRLVLQ